MAPDVNYQITCETEGCEYRTHGENESQLLEALAEHEREEHGEESSEDDRRRRLEEV